MPPGDDPFVRQELAETLYHVLWELVHVFFEHRGLLEGRTRAPCARHRRVGLPVPVPGRARGRPRRRARRRPALGAAEGRGGRRAARADADRGPRRAAGRGRRRCARAFDAGGRLLALGNGGSATDAMDAVADLRDPPARSGWPARPAIDLTEDTAILTALANDIGVEAIFSRQVIAHGRAGDVAAGDLDQRRLGQRARRAARGAPARAAHDRAGRLRRRARSPSERLADHVIVTRSQHIPRIQEAQASAWHALRELDRGGALTAHARRRRGGRRARRGRGDGHDRDARVDRRARPRRPDAAAGDGQAARAGPAATGTAPPAAGGHRGSCTGATARRAAPPSRCCPTGCAAGRGPGPATGWRCGWASSWASARCWACAAPSACRSPSARRWRPTTCSTASSCRRSAAARRS